MLRHLFFDLVERISQHWRDTPTIYIHAIVFLSLTVFSNAILQQGSSPSCPSVNIKKLPLAGLWGTLKSTIRFSSFLTEAYNSVSDELFFSTSDTIIVPSMG